MHELPFLAAPTLVAVLAALGLGAVQLARYLGEAARWRADVESRRGWLCEPRPGPVAIGGRYRDGAGGPWLERAGARIPLDGALRVVRGTRVRWGRAARPIAAVRDGDEVIAIGMMARRAAPGASRRAAPGWVLGPADGAIELCATAPATCPRPLGAVRGAAILGGMGGIAALLVGLLGSAHP